MVKKGKWLAIVEIKLSGTMRFYYNSIKPYTIK